MESIPLEMNLCSFRSGRSSVESACHQGASWSPWGTIAYLGPSFSLWGKLVRHWAVGAPVESPSLPPWLLCSWVHRVSTGWPRTEAGWKPLDLSSEPPGWSASPLWWVLSCRHWCKTRTFTHFVAHSITFSLLILFPNQLVKSCTTAQESMNILTLGYSSLHAKLMTSCVTWCAIHWEYFSSPWVFTVTSKWGGSVAATYIKTNKS